MLICNRDLILPCTSCHDLLYEFLKQAEKDNNKLKLLVEQVFKNNINFSLVGQCKNSNIKLDSKALVMGASQGYIGPMGFLFKRPENDLKDLFKPNDIAFLSSIELLHEKHLNKLPDLISLSPEIRFSKDILKRFEQWINSDFFFHVTQCTKESERTGLYSFFSSIYSFSEYSKVFDDKTLFPGKTGSIIDNLGVSLLDALLNNKEFSCKAVASVIGLGPGLTPLGDDLLCGFLFGLRILSNCSKEAIYTKVLNSLIKCVRKNILKTTFISSGLLNYASEGFYPNAFFYILKDYKAFLNSYGHTSGSGVLAGLMWPILCFYNKCSL